jgi:hypothetical protein
MPVNYVGKIVGDKWMMASTDCTKERDKKLGHYV